MVGNFPPYLAQGGAPAAWVAAYADKDIHYMVGQNDTCNEAYEPGCTSHGLETTCMDNLEGWMRRYRAEHYFRYLSAFFQRPVHQLTVIPNSGHDHTLMFQHPDGLAAIFGDNGAGVSHRQATIALFIVFSCLLGVGVTGMVVYYRRQRATGSPEMSYQQLLHSLDEDEEDWMDDT